MLRMHKRSTLCWWHYRLMLLSELQNKLYFEGMLAIGEGGWSGRPIFRTLYSHFPSPLQWFPPLCAKYCTVLHRESTISPGSYPLGYSASFLHLLKSSPPHYYPWGPPTTISETPSSQTDYKQDTEYIMYLMCVASINWLTQELWRLQTRHRMT